MKIGAREIDQGGRTFIIAELSANHGQNLDEALSLIRAAKAAGADAVKFQTYTADTITLDCSNQYFQVQGTLWNGRNLHDLYDEAHTPWEWHAELFKVAAAHDLIAFSTPFDPTAVAFLEQFSPPAYKIASFEVVDIPLLEAVGKTGRPVILSTGMATLDEIGEAIDALRRSGTNDIVLLKCTSGYPADPAEMNLRTIPDLSEKFNVPVGLSDHTLGTAVPVAAVALGACVIEKHLTRSRAIPGPDSAFSLEPSEFHQMVTDVRSTEAALGRVHYGVSEKDRASRGFRKSLFVAEDIRAGDRFTPANVRSVRPGYGLHPRYLRSVIGERASCDLEKGTPLSWEHVVDGAAILEKPRNHDRTG